MMLMFSIGVILWPVLLILFSLFVPSIILGIVTFFEIKRRVVVEDLSPISCRYALFCWRIKSQKTTYGLLVITSLLLILSFTVLQFFGISKLNDFDAVLNALALILYFYTLVVSLILFDARYYLLPDPLNYLLLWSGIIFAYLDVGIVSLEESIIAVILVYLLLFSIRLSYQWAGKKDALGLGDLKLSAALAAWCGLESTFSLLLLATLLALFYIALKRIWQRVQVQVIPFGPFLGISGIIHYIILFSFR